MKINISKIGILDYGCGNVGSVKNMFSKIDIWSQIITNPNQIINCSALVLPGVGTFDKGVQKMKSTGFWEKTKEAVEIYQKPILGICLGMHLFFEGSEEGNESGFGWFKGNLSRFIPDKSTRVPHLGWRKLENVNSSLFDDTNDKYYFVHSYHAPINLDKKQVLAECNYGITFPASIHKNKIVGFQFHPEKSLKYGMKLLKNWNQNFVNA